MSPENSDSQFLQHIIERFEKLRHLGEGALGQLDAGGFHHQFHPVDNSIAVTVKHLHGNMLSRWTEFLTSDGNKPWRDRDGEFLTRGDESPDQVWAWWSEGWDLTLKTLASLQPSDLQREVTIRGVPLDVMDAILRQYGHYNYHVGQIVQLARAYRGDAWQTLSIAKGKSSEYKARPGD